MRSSENQQSGMYRYMYLRILEYITRKKVSTKNYRTSEILCKQLDLKFSTGVLGRKNVEFFKTTH